MMGGYGDSWWIFMWAWMGVFWLLVLGGGAWVVWRLGLSRRDGASATARETLEQRLARGEISAEQYRALSQELGQGAGAAARRRGVGAGILGVIVALVVAGAVAIPAIAATRGDWDMFDHMGGMMGRGADTANAPVVSGGQAETVTIEDFAFAPGNLVVPVGATVTWTNRDSAPHNATARDGSWKTRTLSEGESDAVTFASAGEYDYYCTVHPSMKAHLIAR